MTHDEAAAKVAARKAENDAATAAGEQLIRDTTAKIARDTKTACDEVDAIWAQVDKAVPA